MRSGLCHGAWREICLLAWRLPGANHAPAPQPVLPAFINGAMQSLMEILLFLPEIAKTEFSNNNACWNQSD